MTDKNTMNKQQRTNREEGLEDIMESMYGEGCGTVHASVKRKKKKVKEADLPPPDEHVVKEAGGDLTALRQEVDEFLKFFGNKAVSDIHADILEIIDKHLGGGGAAQAPAPAPSPSPTGTGQYNSTGAPRRQSQSPIRPSGMSGPGM